MIKQLIRMRRRTKDVYNYWKTFQNLDHHYLKVVKVKEEEYLDAAKRLHAGNYLARGFIQPYEVEDGKIKSRFDPHQHHSQYFVVVDSRNGQVVATSRHIQALRKKGHHSFPIVGNAHLYKRAQLLLSNYAPEDCVEISGLTKERSTTSVAPLLLYRAMWQHSIKQQHQLCLMACDVRLYERLKVLFGPALKKIGNQTPYPGGDVIPAVLFPQEAMMAILNDHPVNPITRRLRRQVIRFILEGLSLDYLQPKTVAKLYELGIFTKK